MIQNAQNLPMLSRSLGLNEFVAQGIGTIWGIGMCTLLLLFAGGLSQILKHKHNPYQKAGAKQTTIYSILGLALSFSLFLLISAVDKLGGGSAAAQTVVPLGGF